MPAPYLDQSIIHDVLRYEPLTGDFFWNKRVGLKAWNTRYAGKPAGYAWKPVPTKELTYRVIRVFDYPFLGHRLAVLWMTGAWPKDVVDHIDGNGMNNAWSNLREANRSQNLANSGPPNTNKTGFKGVSAGHKSGTYRANIRIDGRQTYLGAFDTPEEAHAAYLAAAVQKNGEFAGSR